MQKIEEVEQKTKETQLEVDQPKQNEKVGEDVLESYGGIIFICEETREEKEKKTEGYDYRDVIWQVHAEEEVMHAFPPSEEDSSEIEQIVRTQQEQDEEGKEEDDEELE